MRAALVVALASSACWSSPPPAPIAQHTPQGPALPAPSIAWTDNHLVDRLLPAIATDGSVVVLGIEAPDGARGNPNFHLELRGRDDRVQWSYEVLTVQEVDTGAFIDDTGALTPLRDRIAAANRHLERLHAQHRLVPLKKMALETQTDDVPMTAQTAHGGTWNVAWKGNHVVVTDDRDGKTVLLDRAAPTAWLATPVRTNTHSCENPAFLDATWAAPEHTLLVITVNYEGTDICWEPDAQQHVVAW